MYVTRVPLPSRGKYGKEFVQLERPKIGHLREYLAFTGPNVLAKNAFIQQVCDTDLSKYPTGDREMVFASLRNMVSAPVLSDSFPCKKCTTTKNGYVAYTFDTRKAKIYELPRAYKKDYKLLFPVSKIEREINILTVEKEALAEEYVRYHSEVEEELQHSFLGEDLYTFAKYACMLDGSNDIESLDDNVKFVLDLDVTDFEVIELYDLTYQCGPEMAVDAQCDKCHAPYRLVVPMDSSFFGISFAGLLRKHRFLARHSTHSFNDFLKETVDELDAAYDQEKQYLQKKYKK